MTNILFLLLLYIYFLSPATAQNKPKHISTDLFNSLEELSRLVDISYCVGTTGVHQPFQCLSHCTDFPDLELLTTWNTGPILSDSCGYIALSHLTNRIILSFRGTYSITNTIIDLSIYPQSYTPYSPTCKNCTVHAGFLRSWLHTKPKIIPHLSALRTKYPNHSITLVGHSLGGAVAALAGLEMRLKGWDVNVTTFGEPMIGNAAFAAFMDEQFGEGFRRVTHVGDPVPLLPLAEWGYRPHAGEVFISRVGLPPRVEDVVHCVGVDDPGCSAGREGGLGELRDLNVPVDSGSGEGCRSNGGDGDGDVSGEQAVLGHPDVGCDRLSRRDWSIPTRYRLWELFYAHRDYFWRIGLCVPGGDPTG